MTHPRHLGAEALLMEERPQRARRLSPRELRVECALALAVLCAAIAWPIAQPAADVPVVAVIVCIVAYVAAASVVLYVGAGCALATQLALVPMLWILPISLVPLCAAVALCLWAAPDIVFKHHSRQRLITAIGNAGYVFAPAAVYAIGVSDPGPPSWQVVLLAFAAQCVFDVLLSVAREWLGRGIRPAVQLSVMASVYGVDVLLLPLAVALAERAEDEPLVVLGVVPFSVLLAAVAHDRTLRLTDAADRLEDLERERHRVNVAIHRIGRSLGSSHDRIAVLEVALGTAVDAVAAAAGRARLAGIPRAMVFEAVPRVPGAAEAGALLDVERAALAGSERATAERDGWHALARPLLLARDGEDATIGAMAVCRAGAPFTSGDEVLFSYLVAQTAASIRSIDVHDRLQSELSLDAQTGLANRARFQDVLRAEIERARNTQSPLSLVVIGLDRIDELSSRLGGGAGDAVLHAASARLSERSRVVDEPARFRADRFGVVLPGATIDAARLVADDIRSGIGSLEVPWDQTIIRPTASVGVAALSPRRATREAILLSAELALERAQGAGGNRTVVSVGDPDEERRSPATF